MSLPHNGGGPPPPPQPLTTMVIPIPFTTVTVDTTLVRTTFVTTTAQLPRSSSKTCTALGISGCRVTSSPEGSRSSFASLPSIASRTSLRGGSSAGASQTVLHHSTVGSSTNNGEHSRLTTGHKHAIIGGLSSAIAGLVLIGVLAALLLRRRQGRKAANESSRDKALHQSISRTRSQATHSGTAALQRTPPLSRQSSTADVNGSVIRVSLGGFARPFAHHKSWRESMGPGALMVMNPDHASETNTVGPRESVDSSLNAFRRPRNRSSVISAAFLRQSHSRASSTVPTADRTPAPPVPIISIDPPPSSESSNQQTALVSTKTYAFDSSTPTIQQRAPHDPFFTPSAERLEEAVDAASASPRLQRPTLAVLQGAAGSATRTLSHLGQALNPFRSKASSVVSTDVDGDGTASRQSTLTFSSDGDPFKLDRRSVTDRSSGMLTPRRVEPVPFPSDRMYEGT